MSYVTNYNPGDHKATNIWLTRIKLDAFAVLVCLAFAEVLAVLLYFSPTPRIIPSSDIGSLFTKIVAESEPHWFAKDYVYSDSNIARFYWSLTIPLLKIIWIATDDPATAWLGLQGPLVFAMLIGFYILARRVGIAPLMALIACFACSMPIPTLSEDFWGFGPVPFPRTIFAAIVPWILLLIITPISKSQEVFWPFFLMSVAAFVTYVHILSGPPLAFGLLMACLAHRPRTLSLARWLLSLICSGVYYLILLLPYIVLYLSTYPGGLPSAPETVRVLGFSEGYHNTMAAIGAFMFPKEGYSYYFCPVAIFVNYVFGIYCLVTLCLSRQEDYFLRNTCRALLFLVVGVLLVSFGVPFVDQQVAALRNRTPFQLEFVRGARIATPVLFFAAFLGFSKIASRSQSWRFTVIAFTGFFVLANLVSPLSRVSMQLRYLLLTGDPASARDKEAAKVIRLIREEPMGSQVLTLNVASDVETVVRYYAHKPLIYSEKDRNFIGYSNSRIFFEWLRRRAIIAQFLAPQQNSNDIDSQFRKMLIDFAPSLILIERCWPLFARPCSDVTGVTSVISMSEVPLFDGEIFSLYRVRQR